MPDITIIKLKIRRGTDAQRKTVVLEQGELGYAVDTGRVFIGDGITLGGNSVSPTFHLPLSTQNIRTSTKATQGDIVSEAGWLYQLVGTDGTKLDAWRFIGTETDNRTIEYSTNGQIRVLSLKDNGIGGNSFDGTAAYSQGGLVATLNDGLSANVDKSTITIDLNNKIKVGTINHTNISNSSFLDGLKGGGSSKIGLQLKPGGGMGVDSGGLHVSAFPSIPGGGLVIGNINVDATFDLSKGLQTGQNGLLHAKFYEREDPISYNASQGKLGLSFETSHFKIDSTKLTLNETFPTGQAKTQVEGYFKSVAVSPNGRITGTVSTVIDILSSYTTGGLSSFNGYATSVIESISARDSKNNVVMLSSAGFMCLSGVTTQEGNTIPRSIAIPIFLY